MSDADKDFVVGLLVDKKKEVNGLSNSNSKADTLNPSKSRGPEILSARPVAEPYALRPGTSPAAKLSRRLVNTLHGFNKWTSINRFSTAAVTGGPALKEAVALQASERLANPDQWGGSRKGWVNDESNRQS